MFKRCHQRELEERLRRDGSSTRDWPRCRSAWGNLANLAKALLKGQLVSLEGKIKYRTVEEDVVGKPFKHTIAEIHASSIRRLSKVEAAADPTDGADQRVGHRLFYPKGEVLALRQAIRIFN